MGNPRDILRPGAKITGRRLIEAISSPVVRDGGDVAVSHLDGQASPTNIRPDPRRRVKIYARITGNTPLGGNQWTYAFAQVWHASAGYTGWATWSPGITSATLGVEAFNTYEEMNTGSGIEGIGVNVDNLPVGFALLPVQTGLIVELTLVRDENLAQLEAWMSEPNPIDGTCQETPLGATSGGMTEWNTEKIRQLELRVDYVAGKG